MRRGICILAGAVLVAAWVAGLVPALGETGSRNQGDGNDASPTWAIIYDFTSGDDCKEGKAFADTVRLKLRRQDGWKVVDRLTTQEFSDPVDSKADRARVIKLTGEKLGGQVGVYGSVSTAGGTRRVVAVIVDLRGDKPAWSVEILTDDTERWRAVLGGKLVEVITEQALWKPPEYGDEPEPNAEDLDRPLNAGGGFESGGGWEAPDNVSTFLEKGPKGRGKILRIRTDLKRDPWLAYRKALRLGKADPNKPPRIGRDTSYGCVGGLEGVHFRSEWIPAEAGGRYWLMADHKGRGGAKVFIKGWSLPEGYQPDGLPESALAELGLTPREFAELSEARRKKLIADDVKKNPRRHYRESYRWYLNCGEAKGQWQHFAAPFPPRGGLPESVEFLQIQVYSYWPPGEYLWDNVHLYRDPRQKKPLPEAAPRTKTHERSDPNSTKDD